MTPALRAIVLAAAVVSPLAGSAALGQIGGLGLGESNAPMEVVARGGIEWDRANLRYVARGDAKVTYNNNVIEGDELVAYYREKRDGGTDIFRLDASGRVRITTPSQKVVGDRAIYDSDSGVLVITGKAVKLNTPTEEVTARDSLEYWEAKKLAVARGEATIVAGDRRIRADVLSGYFVPEVATAAARPSAARPPARPPARGQARAATPAPTLAASASGSRLQRVEAFGNVLVSTKSEIVRGDRGVYNADTGVATLAGNVRLTQGGSQQANGDYAEFDLKSGKSRLLARPGQGGDGRVRLLLMPGQTGGATPAPAPANRR